MKKILSILLPEILRFLGVFAPTAAKWKLTRNKYVVENKTVFLCTLQVSAFFIWNLKKDNTFNSVAVAISFFGSFSHTAD